MAICGPAVGFDTGFGFAVGAFEAELEAVSLALGDVVAGGGDVGAVAGGAAEGAGETGGVAASACGGCERTMPLKSKVAKK